MKKKVFLTILTVMVAFTARGAWAEGPYPADMTNGHFGPVGIATPNSNTKGEGKELDIFQSVNALLGTNYTNNAELDPFEFTGNASTWQQNGMGQFALVGVEATNSTTLEEYLAGSPNNRVSPLGNHMFGNPGSTTGKGTASSPYDGTTVSMFPSNAQFGLAIHSDNNYPYTLNGTNHAVNTFFSDPNNNVDGMDHIMVYQLSALTGKQVYLYDPRMQDYSTVVLNCPYLVSFEVVPEINSITGSPSDLDYNDLTFLINGASPYGYGSACVPEPITLALFSIGLLAMAGFALRRQLSPLTMFQMHTL